jgi:hypothetical protein
LNSSQTLPQKELGRLEPPYKSRGEAQIGRLLDRYGIPFFYEQPLIVYDRGRHRIWQPDFTLPTLDGLIIEYAGMPDRPDYMAGINHKQKVYLDNAIQAMFVYPCDLTGPNWPEKLHEKLQQFHYFPFSSKYDPNLPT